ncbi:hypothetical protein [Kaistella carnis]|uniref:hypothetical protein n=1 Tax=Kaistella carnis TaxID=1241979 RepID=UPI0028B178FF|nr:hypothetical protein [Kaistella carnis]
MLSKTCEYALRAMIYIAQQSRDGSNDQHQKNCGRNKLSRTVYWKNTAGIK